MQSQEFISELQKRIGVETADAAVAAARGVLETLADHLAGNAPAKLAAQLPEEIGALITDYKNDPDAEGEGFGVEEFVRRAAERLGTNDTETAKQHSIAVFTVLREAISTGEFDKMRGTLPAEYNELFGEGTFERSRVELPVRNDGVAALDVKLKTQRIRMRFRPYSFAFVEIRGKF